MTQNQVQPNKIEKLSYRMIFFGVLFIVGVIPFMISPYSEQIIK